MDRLLARENCPQSGLLCCCCCSLITGIIVFVCCFSSLEYTQLGLDYSWGWKSVDEKGYTAGRYMLGFAHSFIKFPSTVQTIQFSHESDSAGPPLRSRTSDGLEVSLEVSFQYQFNVSSIYQVYEKYGTDYAPIFVNMAMDLITTTATEFEATQFFNNRTLISNHMELSLKDQFSFEAFAAVPFFQLRSVSLPPEFDNAIQQTEVKKQDVATATAEKQQTRVQQETMVLQAMQKALQIGIAANATAQSTLLQMKAWCEQFNISQGLQAESFAPLLSKLGSNQSLLMEYMQVRAMRDHPDHLSVVSMPNAQHS